MIIKMFDSRIDPQDAWGFIPHFINENDKKPLTEQINAAYSHGGGWNPIKNFLWDRLSLVLSYPGDPAMRPVSGMMLHGVHHGQMVYLYPHAIVVIPSEDGYEVARLD